MRKIRVLIVDDAVAVRRMLANILPEDGALEVAGVAANGRIALAMIPQVNPDVVILDVEMPEMDGLETVREIRKSYARLPVIMFSTLTERGASATLDALALGATDYVTKPSNTGGLPQGIAAIRESLIPKIKEFCSRAAGVETVAPPDRLSSAPRKTDPAKRSARGPLEIVVIGVSTGGPNALAELMPRFPAGFPVPILVVQHMPALFTKLLAERLASQAKIPVKEASAETALKPGCAWIAPGNFHMTVARKGAAIQILTNQEPPENSCRPAVDVLFRSAAQVYRSGTLGVVMTGMGQDGLRGAEWIRDSGGQILAQDEASSVVWGMPGFVVNAGLADQVLPLNQLGDEIVRRVLKTRSNSGLAMAGKIGWDRD